MAVSEMASSKSSSNLKPNKIQTAVMSALAAMSLSQTAIAAVDDANVDNPAGTTITGTAGYGVKLDAGGPYTIANSGEISAERGSTAYGINVNSVTVTSINNTSTGVIKADATTGAAAVGIYVQSNSSVGTITNSGAISAVAASESAYGIYVQDTSTVGTLTNSGTITASAGDSFARGIYVDNTSTVGTITNSGTISASVGEDDAVGIFIDDSSTIATFNNTGTISVTAGIKEATGILFRSNSTITTLTNSGLIEAISLGANANGIDMQDDDATGINTITTLTNTGTISGSAAGSIGRGVNLDERSLIISLDNQGLIQGAAGATYGRGVRLSSASSITTLTNSGTINALAKTNARGISVSGVPTTGSSIGTLNNSGTISALATSETAYGIHITDTSSSITTLTNTGMITGSVTGAGVNAFGVRNDSGVITTFNNQQTGLTYSGTLPDNYTTIIDDSGYGQLFVSNEAQAAAGATVYQPFAGAAGIGVKIKTNTYNNVISGVTSTNIGAKSGTLTGDGTSSSGSTAWTLNETASGSKAWNLNTTGNYFYFGSVAALQNSLNKTANAMRGAFNSISASMNFANMTTYDCNLFGNNGGCVSVGGRYTGTDNPDTTNTAVVAKAGYKFNEHFRYGAFVDQTANSKSGNVDLDMNTPMVGFMGVWNQNPDQLGMQVKLANTYQRTDATITRNGLGNDFSGDTDIDAQSYVAELSWHHLNDQKNTLLQPFVATRYAIINQDSYSDGFVNYGSVEQTTLTALAGVKAFYQYSPKMTYLGSLGMEYDLDEDADDLSVTVSGVSGLTAASMTGGGEDKTRFLGSVGARFFVTPNQRLEGKVMYEQLRYNNADSTTAYVNYTIGF